MGRFRKKVEPKQLVEIHIAEVSPTIGCYCTYDCMIENMCRSMGEVIGIYEDNFYRKFIYSQEDGDSCGYKEGQTVTEPIEDWCIYSLDGVSYE